MTHATLGSRTGQLASGAPGGGVLHISRRMAREVRLPWKALLRSKARELSVRARGGRIQGQGMIGADPRAVLDGFSRLRDEEFHAYNLPQVWVESRQIPRAISGRVPRFGARLLDLGCGPGTSTEILCRFGNPSWEIIGFEAVSRYVEVARARGAAGSFRSARGEVMRPWFECQDISRPLVVRGERVADGSADFAISGGVVGLYLRPAQVESLVHELARVVRAGGFIALDSGPAISARVLRTLAEEAGFTYVRRCRSVWLEPRPKLVFRRA
ncbi:MAG: class I SAM-dependent methyltransferase [Planctomycetota bacterium]|nr:class I SAM-dependent methyltransferase [Planctomycetota bacterium]